MKASTKRTGNGKATSGGSTQGAPARDDEHRNDHIATAAYFKAEARGFLPGQDLDDWLAAEAEFAARRNP